MGSKSRLRQHSPDAAGVPRGRQRLERASLDGAELEYEVSGTGEPVVFIHGAFIADTFRPLLAEPSLAGHYRLILYHRRGYADSSRASRPVSVAQQAADCRALLHHLGVENGHMWWGTRTAAMSPSSWRWAPRALSTRWPCWSRG